MTSVHRVQRTRSEKRVKMEIYEFYNKNLTVKECRMDGPTQPWPTRHINFTCLQEFTGAVRDVTCLLTTHWHQASSG